MSTALAEMPQTEELQGEARAILDKANAVAIVDDTTFRGAADLLRTFKTYSKRVSDTFDPLIKSQNEAVKKTRETMKTFARPAEEAEGIVKRKMADYQQEQERRAAEEAARLREQAMKEAEERRLQEAIALERAGDKRAAEAAIEAPIVAPPPPIAARPTPKVEGVSFKTAYKFEVTDESIVPREFLKVDEVKLGGYVRSMKAAAIDKIPGVRVWEEKQVAASAF